MTKQIPVVNSYLKNISINNIRDYYAPKPWEQSTPQLYSAFDRAKAEYIAALKADLVNKIAAAEKTTFIDVFPKGALLTEEA